MAPTRANTMPSATGHILRPSQRVVDIRDDFSTKVFGKAQDPYEVGGPSVDSAFSAGSPKHDPAITPPPGFHNGSPIARSMSGDTVVPMPDVPVEQPSRQPSFAAIVEQFLPAPSMPDLASIHTTRADLLDALHKLGNRTDDVALIALNMTRESFYDAIEAFEKPFAVWKEHIFDLIVASAAYRAGREDEIATHFAGLNDDWECGSLTAMRYPVNIGLSQQIEELAKAFAAFRNSSLPPLLDQETERWGERDAAVRQSASNTRLVIVKTASHVIEALSPTLIDKRTTQLAKLLYGEAKNLLTPNNDQYNRGTVALALHRILPAIRDKQHSDASKVLALAYHDLIRNADSVQNASLILSYGNLAQNAADKMIYSARMTFKSSVIKLGEIMKEGETPDIQDLARNTQSIIAEKLDDLGI